MGGLHTNVNRSVFHQHLLHLQDGMGWLESLRLCLAGWDRTGNAGSRFYEVQLAAKEGMY